MIFQRFFLLNRNWTIIANQFKPDMSDWIIVLANVKHWKDNLFKQARHTVIVKNTFRT